MEVISPGSNLFLLEEANPEYQESLIFPHKFPSLN